VLLSINESLVPKYRFASNIEEQMEQLASNPLLKRFAESRKRLAEEPYRPVYHYVNPEGNLNDPNGLCFWKGYWHLFYQAYPPEDPRQHWGHAISKDLIHWGDLPYAIYPGPEYQCFSGATYVEKDRVIAMYHGTRLGNMVAISDDPLLLNWQKVNHTAVIPTVNADGTVPNYVVFDPCIWKENGLYYSLSGQRQPSSCGKSVRRAHYLFRSEDLMKWEYLHEFVENDCFTLDGDDGACPYFWPIGDRHILLFFSHMSGSQYLLGDYEKEKCKFLATAHGRFNFGPARPSGVHAPSAAPDGAGNVVVIFNMNPGKPTSGWNQAMTLPRQLTLVGDDQLRIAPVEDVARLQCQHRHVPGMNLPADKEVVFDEIEGNAMEILAQIEPKGAALVELNVLRSPGKEEFTRIAFFKKRGYINPIEKRHYSLVTIDSSYSSTLPDAQIRGPETAHVFLDDQETLTLRVFIDKSIVEVFVNERQCLAVRVYPGRSDSTGVSIRARGQNAALKSLDAWQMKSIYSFTGKNPYSCGKHQLINGVSDLV